MNTRINKPYWFIMCIVLLIILFIYKNKNKPIELVVSNKENKEMTSGVILQVNNYLSQSSLGDAQINGVFVTECQQDFYFEEAKAAVEAEESQDAYMDKLLSEKAFELSENDEYLLAKITQCEAGNQDMDAKEAVVMTILNRVDDINFPNTIEGVITQKYNGVYQFSPLIPGGSWYYTEPLDESYEAIHNVQNLISDKFLWLDCLYFESLPPDVDNWHSKNLEFVVQYDDIRFYK